MATVRVVSERDSFYKFLKKVAIGPAVEVAFHPWVEGLENIPDVGPAILASNHLSFSDSIFLPIAVPRKDLENETISYYQTASEMLKNKKYQK